MLEKIPGKEKSDLTHEEQEEIARGVTGLGFAGNWITVARTILLTNVFRFLSCRRYRKFSQVLMATARTYPSDL